MDSVSWVENLRTFLEYIGLYDEESSSPFAMWKFIDTLAQSNEFLSGFGYTLSVSILALLIALIFGTIGGVMATSKITILRAYTRMYVEIFQNTPLVIQIFFLYFALPPLGIHLDVFSVGVLGVGAYHGAYVSEVVRSGILAVPKGQFEASASQGFTYTQQMRYIILPQTFRKVIPSMLSQIITTFKDTSFLAGLQIAELTYQSKIILAQLASFQEILAMIGLIAGVYFVICFSLSVLVRYLDKKMAYIS